jgi:hypothetical protein
MNNIICSCGYSDVMLLNIRRVALQSDISMKGNPFEWILIIMLDSMVMYSGEIKEK